MEPDQILDEGAQQFQQPAQPQPEQPQQAQQPPQDVDWTPPSQAEMQEVAQAYFALQQHAANLEAQIRNIQTQPQQEEEDDNAIADDDQLDPEMIRQVIRQEAIAAQNEALAQNPMIQQMAEQRGAQIAAAAFEQWKPQLGQFDENLALSLANSYGAANPGLQPMQALWMGANEAKAYGDRLRTQVADEYQKNLTNRLEAPQQPGPGVANAAVEGRPASRSYEEVTKDFLARRNLNLSPN